MDSSPNNSPQKEVIEELKHASEESKSEDDMEINSEIEVVEESQDQQNLESRSNSDHSSNKRSTPEDENDDSDDMHSEFMKQVVDIP